MLAAFIAACCAANGVPLRDPRKPSEPELFHEITLPAISEIVTMVLLKEAWMCTSPWGTCLRSFFLKVFFLPFFSGATAPPVAAGLAIVLSSLFPGLSHPGPGSQGEREPRAEHCRLGFRAGLLFIGHGSLARALAGSRVGVGALSAHGQVTAVTIPAVGADFDEPLDVHRNFLAEIAFHHAFSLDDLADTVDLVFAQVLDLLVRVDLGLFQDAARARIADAVDVSERDYHMLVAWKIDACNAC